jgi:peptidyl-prolyl cis-trans isomerase A (cyclophilin A)
MLNALSRSLIVTAALGLSTELLPAQQRTGVIAGQVDNEAGLLPGVKVTIAAGEKSQDTFTDANGRYRFDALPEGVYVEWFSLPGFRTEVRRAVTVNAGAVLNIDATLQISVLCAHCEKPPLPDPPRIRFETTLGAFIIALEPYVAPITVTNFLQYVDGEFYGNGRVHRATRSDNYVVSLPNRPLLEVVQAGIDPAKKPKAFPPIPLERTSVTGLKHVVGTVSMARGTGADTATSDFFILLNDQPSLDFGGKRFDDQQGAAAFGRVVSGMDVVRKIQQQPTEGQALMPPITILSAKRVNP